MNSNKTTTTSKHYIKYIRIVDNTGYENYLNTVDVYGVLEIMVGDIATYYRLDTEATYKEGMWISVSRCSDVTFPNSKDCEHLYASDEKFKIDIPNLKPIVERVICIPDEDGHIVDLQRIQYISPLNGKFVDDDSYIVTLVSGWEIKLMDKVYSREKLIRLWRMLQNK